MATEKGIRRVIIDADVGIDDWLAISLLLHADKVGKVKIEAIVCTNGNTTLDNVCKNVMRLLETTGRTDIPVYAGSRKQLIPPQQDARKVFVHGSDGFGGLDHETEPDMSRINISIPAAVAMRDLALRHPGEVSLVILGPMTNVALSMRLFDDFEPNLKDIWVMGGNYTARGNVTPSAEFNFYMDPEAVHIVLEEATRPIYIVPWETCDTHPISFEWRFEVFGKVDAPEIQLLNKAEKVVFSTVRTRKDWVSCDTFLAAAFLEPEKIILGKTEHTAAMELRGERTRGQVVLDHRNKDSINVTIVERLDIEHYKAMLLELGNKQ